MAGPPLPARPPGGEVAGVSIGARLAPWIGELDPDPRRGARAAPALRDDHATLRLYREALRDERVAAALDQRLDAVTARPWEVEPGGGGRLDRLAAADLRAQLDALDMAAACRQMLMGAVWYGYALAECLWRAEGARVRLAALRVRAPDRFRWAPDGPRLRSEGAPLGTALPPGKFVVLARPGEHGDIPHGPGLARWCYWPVFLRRHGLRFWSIALEKFGAPTARGSYPRGASEEEREALLAIVRDLATGVGAILPEDQAIEIVDSARRAGGDFEAYMGYLDRAIATTILGQSSTTDQGPWRGTAEVQRRVRDETVAADARLLDDALNATLARWLAGWNAPGAAPPRIRRSVAPGEDLDARAAREALIARTAALRPTRAHIEQVYGGAWEDAPR